MFRFFADTNTFGISQATEIFVDLKVRSVLRYVRTADTGYNSEPNEVIKGLSLALMAVDFDFYVNEGWGKNLNPPPIFCTVIVA